MKIAVMAGGRWPDAAHELIIRNLAEDAAEREAGLRARPPGMALLADLYKVWDVDEKYVPTLDLVARLIAHDSDYWGENSPAAARNMVCSNLVTARRADSTRRSAAPNADADFTEEQAMAGARRARRMRDHVVVKASVMDGYDGLCACSKSLARVDTGSCDMCSAIPLHLQRSTTYLSLPKSMLCGLEAHRTVLFGVLQPVEHHPGSTSA
jgi:Protein of unknown function (DUF3631)